MRGQELFFGKAQCATCHPPPYYTDNSMHNLQAERFFKPQHDQRRAWPSADGPIKTFPLRGIKDSPPYLHDGRLLTLEDTVEFFNLVLEHEADASRRRRTWSRSCAACEALERDGAQRVWPRSGRPPAWAWACASNASPPGACRPRRDFVDAYGPGRRSSLAARHALRSKS